MSTFTLYSRFYFSRLSPENRRIYRAVYDQWAAGVRDADITLMGSGFHACNGLELHDVVGYILSDNPQLFHLDSSQIVYRRFSGRRVCISAHSLYTPEEYQAVYQKLLVRIESILSRPELVGPPEARLRALHDYLASSVVYSLGSGGSRTQREAHTIVGALLNQACVCEGCAHALRLLCDMARISCMVVNGTGKRNGAWEPHAWNMVKLEGRIYHVDVTWDISPSCSDRPLTDYYLRGDTFFVQRHSWDRSFYPPCPKDHPDRTLAAKIQWR